MVFGKSAEKMFGNNNSNKKNPDVDIKIVENLIQNPKDKKFKWYKKVSSIRLEMQHTMQNFFIYRLRKKMIEGKRRCYHFWKILII